MYQLGSVWWEQFVFLIISLEDVSRAQILNTYVSFFMDPVSFCWTLGFLEFPFHMNSRAYQSPKREHRLHLFLNRKNCPRSNSAQSLRLHDWATLFNYCHDVCDFGVCVFFTDLERPKLRLKLPIIFYLHSTSHILSKLESVIDLDEPLNRYLVQV